MNKTFIDQLKNLSLSERVEAINLLQTSTVQLKDILPNLGQTTLPMPQVKRKRGRPRKNTLAPQVTEANQPVVPEAPRKPDFSFEARKYSPEEIPLRPGDRVRVPRGTHIVFPDSPEKGIAQMRRSRTVTIKEIFLGAENKTPTVCWTGSGNYKRAASINDVLKSA